MQTALCAAPTIRVGLPLPAGKIVEAARDAGLPVLFSANAFMKRGKGGYGEVDRVRLADRAYFGNLNASLDSAGFVAAAKYRGYPWSIDQYLNLADSFDWAWYSSMDYCVEPEIAGSQAEVMFRMAETCRLYTEVRRAAEDRGMTRMPIPILQGWTPAQYLWCMDHFPLWQWPDLIGIGSMCRRNIHGELGVLAAIDALDRELPSNVKFHLFGVKGKALDLLANHPRIASVDSMAWDFRCRREHPTGRTTDVRTKFMFDWHKKNMAAAANAKPQHTPSPLLIEPEKCSDELQHWLELVVSNEIEGNSAQWHYMSGAYTEDLTAA